MNQHAFMIQHERGVATYGEENQDEFLAALDSLLQLGLEVSVSIAVSAVHIVDDIGNIFRKRGFRARILADSDERAIDYIATGFAGAVIGGSIGGAVAWLTLAVSRVPALAPSIGISLAPSIGIPMAVCATLGTIIGMVATKRGYSITARLREERLLINAMPA